MKFKLNYANLTSNPSLYADDIFLVLHEMFHGLVFSSSLYETYIDSAGNLRTNSTVLLFLYYLFIINI